MKPLLILLLSCSIVSQLGCGKKKSSEKNGTEGNIVLNSPANAEKVTVKVVVIYQNPPISAEGGKRLHEIFGFNDPVELNRIYKDSMEAFSHNTVNYEIVETIDEDRMWTKFKDSTDYLSKERVYELLSEPNFTELKERNPRFDYEGFVRHYGFGEKRDNDQVNEVWVWSWPVAGMWESQQVGQDAFWCNSTPLKMANKKTFTIMGFNYERTADLALHSFGHRAESVMRKVYERWEPIDSGVHPENPNNWELFTSLEKNNTDLGNVGNCHFPVNAESDYDYENTREVKSYFKVWENYPNLDLNTATPEMVDCSNWDCSQTGYMSWWYRKFPHFEGLNQEDQKLNNWWHYLVDYEGALELEENLKHSS